MVFSKLKKQRLSDEGSGTRRKLQPPIL